MADSRLLIGCQKCGKACHLCLLGFDGEAWARPASQNNYDHVLEFLSEHLEGKCGEGFKNPVEAAGMIFRLVVEHQCFYSSEHKWLLLDHVQNYGVKIKLE